MKVLPIVLLLAGVALGFLAGRGTAPDAGGGGDRSPQYGSTPPRSLGAPENGGNDAPGDNGTDEDGETGSDGQSPRITALTRAFDAKKGKRRNFDIQAAIYDLSLEELEAAWDLVEDRMDSDSGSWEWATAYFSRWAELDRDGAIEKAETLESWRGSSALRAIAQSWAEKDPAAALKWAAEREKKSQRTYVYNGVLEAIASTDKMRAFDLAVDAVEKKIIDGGSWWGVGFFSEWASEAPALAASKALELPHDRLSTDSLRRVMEVWAKESPEDAMKWLEGNEDKNLRNRMMSSVIEGWLKEEPLKAMDYALKDALERTEPGLLRTSARNFAKKDWDGARNWVESIEDETMRDEARLAIADSFNWEDPKKSAEYLAQFSDNPRFLSQLQNTTWTWSRSDPDGAFDWANENLPESAKRGEFLSRIIGTWGEVAPDKAVNHLDQIDEQRNREDAYQNVARSWANSDMDAARGWADSIPEGPEKDHAVAGIVSKLAEKDPYGASEWLQSFPEGGTRDRAVGSFVARIVDKDPEGAWEWSQSITDPRRRALTIENTARRLLQYDREAYESMIRSTEALGEEAKWRLLDAN